MLVIPTLDASAVFGAAVKMEMIPADLQMSTAAFFGVEGVFSIFGGGRGRMWRTSGLVSGTGLSGLVIARGLLLAFNDGQPHALVDTWGVAWYPVVFAGGFRPVGPLLFLPDGVYGQEYELLLTGNI